MYWKSKVCTVDSTHNSKSDWTIAGFEGIRNNFRRNRHLSQNLRHMKNLEKWKKRKREEETPELHKKWESAWKFKIFKEILRGTENTYLNFVFKGMFKIHKLSNYFCHFTLQGALSYVFNQEVLEEPTIHKTIPKFFLYQEKLCFSLRLLIWKN